MKNEFVHLNVHTSYSLQGSICKVAPLVKRARQLGMKALAITDCGNMFGVMEFYAACRSTRGEFEGLPPIKPIVGCELCLVDGDYSVRKWAQTHTVRLLARNGAGYPNLVKLVSEANIRGFYNVARINRELLEKYHEGLICLSGGLVGEVGRCLDPTVTEGESKDALETAKWYRDLFGEDYCLEVQYHPYCRKGFSISAEQKSELEELARREQSVAEATIELGAELGVKVVLTNDVRFVGQEDAEAFEVWRALGTGNKMSSKFRPVCSGSEWFKNADEMAELFPEHPELLTKTVEMADRIEEYGDCGLYRMPDYPVVGASFADDKETLRAKVFDGAERRWGSPLAPEIRERLEFELSVIDRERCNGYVLMVEDYVRAAREMGVFVGPGRGAAAGSAVLYSLGVTGVDPIKYDLLFERFLSPERIMMADIDLDFDDEGRNKVVEYLVNKYGADRVAHIVTFGRCGPRTAIKDVARVCEYPYEMAASLADLVPDFPMLTFKRAIAMSEALSDAYKNGSDDEKRILCFAEKLDGCIRQPGTHACGLVIGSKPLVETLPMMRALNKERMLCTQYDGHYVEPVGLIKYDYLGLKTLSIFRRCLAQIKVRRRKEVDLDRIPDDDKETFKAFGRGETEEAFQFESPGMKYWLGEMKPDRFSDLVALNAMYRPGPMDDLPSLVASKHGRKEILYAHPLLKDTLAETYGYTVYQEQVMILSRLLAGFTRGESDKLRKAMGKRMVAILVELREKFITGCVANPAFRIGEFANEDRAKECAEAIWGEWERCGVNLFNKSHAVCYAWVAYAAMYLKTHYPEEFAFAVEECRAE